MDGNESGDLLIPMSSEIKILILDDRKSDVDVILFELKKAGIGFSYEVAHNREEYERALDKFVPDIVLSDYAMPAFDGITAFNIIQKKYPDVPFLIVSSAIGEENAVEMIKNGVTDYVLKNKLFTLNTKVARALRDADDKLERKSMEKKMREMCGQLEYLLTKNSELNSQEEVAACLQIIQELNQFHQSQTPQGT